MSPKNRKCESIDGLTIGYEHLLSLALLVKLLQLQPPNISTLSGSCVAVCRRDLHLL